jgi:hypothetical protein
MELDPYLVTVPGHMIMEVYLNEEHREQLEIETTMAGASPLEDAVKVGSGIHGKSEGEFDGENPNFQIIEIELDRQDGVIPLKDGQQAAGKFIASAPSADRCSRSFPDNPPQSGAGPGGCR